MTARAEALRFVRAFFFKRNVIEVDTPLLQTYPPIDPFIEILEVVSGGFLHSSPEYAMKSLLARGAGDIYQLSHVFRKGEVSAKHRQEFTMLEWYRVGKTLTFLQEETLALLQHFIGTYPVQRMTYQEALFTACGKGVDEVEDLDYTWAFEVEPTFPKETFVIITDFPEKMAALAQVKEGVAMRFEIYFNGYELANGYNELRSKAEYETRLSLHNAQRETPLPMNQEFLESLSQPLPECVGVAVGFDRLLILQQSEKAISAVTY